MNDSSRVRVSIVGVVVVALFASLFARLWFLQTGPEQRLRDDGAALASRRVQTPAPRGRILDRNGVVLARDRTAWAITVDRSLPTEERNRVLGSLSELLGIETADLRRNYESPRQSSLLPAVVALDVPIARRLAILEHPDAYPGVSVERLTVREYPAGVRFGNPALAAQLLGYVGEINSDQLADRREAGYQAGDLIGRNGIEAAYEGDLRGRPEVIAVEVDPAGRQVGATRVLQRGRPGHDVVLTIDAGIQAAAESALTEAIAVARTRKDETKSDQGFETLEAPGGAVVVLDVRDGAVVALASNPSFPPAGWIGGISQADYDRLNDPANHFPLLNRATQGQYAPGSTFKLVSALAGTRFGLRAPTDWFVDEGSVEIGDRRFQNDNGIRHGSVDLTRALSVSSDTYFYTLGDDFWRRWNRGDTATGSGLQEEARALGFGAPTGLEIDESSGRVPDPEWKRDFANKLYRTDAERRDYGRWYPGDVVLMAIGQGDLLVTPVQLANAFATFANGGTRWKLHLGGTVKDSSGEVVRTIEPEAAGRIELDPVAAARMKTGFRDVLQSEEGTAYWAFSGFPFERLPGGIAGKTGTAQVAGKGLTSVFAAYFPADAPRYVAVALVEEAGHGSEIAAPIVRRVAEAIVGAAPSPIAPGAVEARD